MQEVKKGREKIIIERVMQNEDMEGGLLRRKKGQRKGKERSVGGEEGHKAMRRVSEAKTEKEKRRS